LHVGVFRRKTRIWSAYDDPNIESDLGVYSTQFGLPNCTTANGCFKKVNQSGGSSYPRKDAGWALEISMAAMTDHILQAYRVDIETRTNPNGPMRDAGRFPDAWKVNAHEIKAGVVYKDDKVTVTAFATKHAMESYGYRFDTPDRRIVISGDTNPVEETIEACDGCDILIHEAQSVELLSKLPASIQSFVAKYHTTTEQLAELAKKAKPQLLIVYHTISFPPGIAPARLLPPKAAADALYASPEMLQKEIGSRYSGKFVIGKDLDVF